jgi:hypothetical protein
MNPILYVAAGLLGLYAVAGKSTASAAGTSVQDQMIFRDYAWITLLPDAHDSGGSYVALVGAMPPPPGVLRKSGNWTVYAGGQAKTTGGNGVPFQEWPNVPQGQMILMWCPTAGTLMQSCGYFLYGTHCKWERTKDGGHAGSGHDTKYGAWKKYAQAGLICYAIENPPPPPGQTSSTGSWHLAHPGLLVWLTPTNAASKDATLAAQAFTLPPGAELPPGTLNGPAGTSPAPSTATPGATMMTSSTSTASGYYGYN